VRGARIFQGYAGHIELLLSSPGMRLTDAASLTLEPSRS
jgi:hypothetical protein